MLLTQPDAPLSAPRESNVSAAVSADGKGALTSRLLQSVIHALELYSIYLGKELMYAALQSREFVTPPELARRTGIAPRYAREWLEQQAVAGFLEVDAPLAAADTRTYRLPPAHVNVLVTEDHPAHLAPLAQMVAGIGGAIEPVLAAYRSGGGVPYPVFGAAFRNGQAGISRPAFAKDLVERWIPAAADIHSRLVSSRLRVADAGCGAGWSTIAMAQAFPQADVIGFDADDDKGDEIRIVVMSPPPIVVTAQGRRIF